MKFRDDIIPEEVEEDGPEEEGGIDRDEVHVSDDICIGSWELTSSLQDGTQEDTSEESDLEERHVIKALGNGMGHLIY